MWLRELWDLTDTIVEQRPKAWNVQTMNILTISIVRGACDFTLSDEDINDHGHICPFHLRLSMNMKTGSLL